MPLLFLHIPKKKREVNAMRCMLCIQCAIRGLLTINGQFCGPVDGEGQTFPTARDAEIFIEYMPLTENAKPMALELALEQGKVSRIEPAPHGYALIWPDGLIQLELRPEAPDMPEAGETEQAAPNVLLRYLTMRLAGDAGADALLMRAVRRMAGPPMTRLCRFALRRCMAPERFDERAGLVTRLAPNIARVNAALAVTVPTGQGRRMIERIEVMETVTPNKHSRN